MISTQILGFSSPMEPRYAMSASIRIAPNNGLHSHNYRVLYNDSLGPFSLQSGITPNSSVTLSNVYVLFHAGLSGGCHHSYPVARTSPRPRSSTYKLHNELSFWGGRPYGKAEFLQIIQPVREKAFTQRIFRKSFKETVASGQLMAVELPSSLRTSW